LAGRVSFLEAKLQHRGPAAPGPGEPYAIPVGKAAVKREGTDVTLVATMAMVPRALAAAESLARQGHSVEVIDPRTLAPLDEETLVESARKTSRCIVIDEGYRRFGATAELASLVAERAFYWLDAPVQRIARRLDRPHQHGADFGLEPPPHHVHPVGVDRHREGAAAVADLLGRELAVTRQRLPPPHQPFQPRSRSRLRVLEQRGLGLGRGDPGHGADLGVRELAALHGGGGQREFRERMGDPHVLPRGGQRPPGAPGEPFGAGGEVVGPAFAPFEVGDEGEHFIGGDVDAGGEFGDPFAEFEEVVGHGEVS